MHIFLILSLLASPVMANNKTILIKRSKPKKEALLDYKFIFMEEQAAFKATEGVSSSQTKRSNPMHQSSQTLNNLSQPIALKPKILSSSAPGNDEKIIDIHNDSNWDSYAIEADENLGVQAWITGGLRSSQE